MHLNATAVEIENYFMQENALWDKNTYNAENKQNDSKQRWAI